jgi:multiple sugar transport system substrate-binding protein
MLHHDASRQRKRIPPLRRARSRGRRVALAVALAGLLQAITPAAPAGTLVINADTSNPAPRAAWLAAVEVFKAENPDIDVSFNVYDHESYKKALRNWLTSESPDVVYWYVGERMKQFVGPGLLEDVSDLFAPSVRYEIPKTALDLVTVDGKQYGVPYTYYDIGMYYRRDLFEKAGIAQPPRTWDELLQACARLKAIGLAPIAIGSKDLWPTAAWFDYIDLRLNGYDFHMQLMSGRISYTDPRVVAVFERWRELVDQDFFAPNHVGMTWQESQALLYQGRAAMMLIGNFITPNFPPEIRDDIGVHPSGETGNW